MASSLIVANNRAPKRDPEQFSEHTNIEHRRGERVLRRIMEIMSHTTISHGTHADELSKLAIVYTSADWKKLSNARREYIHGYTKAMRDVRYSRDLVWMLRKDMTYPPREGCVECRKDIETREGMTPFGWANLMGAHVWRNSPNPSEPMCFEPWKVI